MESSAELGLAWVARSSDTMGGCLGEGEPLIGNENVDSHWLPCGSTFGSIILASQPVRDLRWSRQFQDKLCDLGHGHVLEAGRSASSE